ncbi:MAG: hypothetical protein WC099_02830 [Candidatus Paceibacterota bacterium]
MKIQQPLISIIMPCGKDVRRITAALVTLNAYFEKKSFSYELILLPYTTSTHIKDILHRFISIIPHTRIQEVKGGHEGIAIQKGMLEAHGLIRMYMTPIAASSITSYETIEQWFRKGYDVIVGSRIHTTVSSLTRIPFLERVFQWIMQRILAPSVYDTDNGWAAYSQKSAIILFPHTVACTATIIRESIALAHIQQLKVKELYLEHHTFSSSRKLSLYLKGIIEAIHIRIRLSTRAYAIKKPL